MCRVSIYSEKTPAATMQQQQPESPGQPDGIGVRRLGQRIFGILSLVVSLTDALLTSILSLRLTMSRILSSQCCMTRFSVNWFLELVSMPTDTVPKVGRVTVKLSCRRRWAHK